MVAMAMTLLAPLEAAKGEGKGSFSTLSFIFPFQILSKPQMQEWEPLWCAVLHCPAPTCAHIFHPSLPSGTVLCATKHLPLHTRPVPAFLRPADPSPTPSLPSSQGHCHHHKHPLLSRPVLGGVSGSESTQAPTLGICWP